MLSGGKPAAIPAGCQSKNMFHGPEHFGGMVKSGGFMLFQNIGSGTSPDSIAQSARLWAQIMLDEQKTGKKVDVIESAGGSSNALFRSAGILKFLAHVANGKSEEHTSELQSRQYLVCR